MPQLSPILWVVFPVYLFFMLIVVFMIMIDGLGEDYLESVVSEMGSKGLEW